jgi:hypothetical protein
MAKVDTYYITDLEYELIKIDNSSLGPKFKDGALGEKFVKYGLRYYFWSKGFKVRSKGERTFRYKDNSKSLGGIDLRFWFNYNNNLFENYIEVKNWADHYSIPYSDFKSEILDRFTRNANQPGINWIVTMNVNNIKKISKNCQKYNIHIIPIDTKITTNQINIPTLTKMMENFLDNTSMIFDGITGRKISDVKLKTKKLTDGKMDWDLRLGLPYDLISKKHKNVSIKSIKKRNSVLRARGIDLPDRRSKEWRGMQIMTKDLLDAFLDNIIQEMQDRNNKLRKRKDKNYSSSGIVG